jgi:hypothetical protein
MRREALVVVCLLGVAVTWLAMVPGRSGAG